MRLLEVGNRTDGCSGIPQSRNGVFSDFFLLQGTKNVRGGGQICIIALYLANVDSLTMTGRYTTTFSSNIRDFCVRFTVQCLPSTTGTNTPYAPKKTMSIDFACDLLMRIFFIQGKALVCHSTLCALVSGSYSKIQYSSQIITLPKVFGSVFKMSAFSRVCPLKYHLNGQTDDDLQKLQTSWYVCLYISSHAHPVLSQLQNAPLVRH